MKKQYLWLIEIIIWFLIIALVVFFAHRKITEKSRYYAKMQIQFEDTYGLIVGSPVKYMGVQVGYVSKMKIQDNNVLVEFVLTEKGLKIDEGSIATIEFSGLAASKSLELYPPPKGQYKTAALVSVQPYKIANYKENQKNISSNIVEMSGNIGNVFESNFVKQLEDELKSRNIYNTAQKSLDAIIEIENSLIVNHNQRMEKFKNNGK